MKTMLSKICMPLLLVCTFTVQAETESEDEYLLGSIGGLREKLNLEMGYTGEYGKSSGGIKDASNYLDNLDISMTFDDVFGQEGSTFFVYFVYNAGDGPSDDIGDAQGASNIDGPTTSKLYEFWYETGLGESGSVKAGMMDLNGEFDVIETAGLFLNGSHGIGPDYSQSGVNGPSVFPFTSAGLRFAFNMDNGVYFQFAAFDGVAGDPNNVHGTHVKFESNDGWLIPLEGGYIEGEPGSAGYLKAAFGAWSYTEGMAFDVNDNPISDTKNSGFYALVDYGFTDSISAFLRYGVADEELNEIESYLGAGVVYSGLFDSADNQLGLSIAKADLSGEVITAVEAGGGQIEDNETVIELSYRTVINSWLAVQPDIQWIKSPGFDPTLDDATLVSVRFEITL